ncbi:pentatricopeptide repeat-containing protein At3g51320-like [Nicotiana sylvestris]|uniref:Pentatricopeptide repeat-containing protein At3g51320-like n=1 Tax=Nicotiana sylvestris TaxID=4096 RepID=A0A1U7X651_NICSY|nr:PREDICTED: pentatricopeptide repeat-containing protein At3g51320-like [Nicotiana sylvestris]
MAARISIKHLIPFTIPSHLSKRSVFSSYSASHQSKALGFLDSCQSLAQLFQIQAHLIITGLLQVQNPSFSCRFLNLCTQHCDVEYTSLVFKCIDFPDTFSVNTVIKAYACSSVPHNAVVFYFERLKNGFLPNSFTFPPLMSSCAKAGNLDLGQKCHGQLVKNGVDGVLHVQNSLVHCYSCCGFIGLSRQVFDEMSQRDAVSWNSIVNGYVKVGELVAARQLFDAMPRRNLVGWNVMMNGYLESNNPGKCLKLFREMAQRGLNGNDATVAIVLTACARSARMKEGKSVHGSLIKVSKDLNLITSTTLIHMYSRCGRAEIARLIFDRISVKNIVCWNAMILGFCIHGNPKDGLNLYADLLSSRLEGTEKDHVTNMKQGGGDHVLPDEITFVGVLCACAREGLLTEARTHFGDMSDLFGIKPNFLHYWCMANLLANIGLMQEAIKTMEDIPAESNLPLESSLWSELLVSARFRGDVILGEQIANKLIEEDPKNFRHYLLLVNIYAAAGRWDEVAQTKKRMKKRGIERIPGCSLKDLKEIVDNMTET